MIAQASMILIAVGTLGLAFGREWYNALAGVVLLVAGLWMGGYLPGLS